MAQTCSSALHRGINVSAKATRHYMWQTHKTSVASWCARFLRAGLIRRDSTFSHSSLIQLCCSRVCAVQRQRGFSSKWGLRYRCVTPELLLSLPAEYISKQFYPSPKKTLCLRLMLSVHGTPTPHAIYQSFRKRWPGDELANATKGLQNRTKRWQSALIRCAWSTFSCVLYHAADCRKIEERQTYRWLHMNTSPPGGSRRSPHIWVLQRNICTQLGNVWNLWGSVSHKQVTFWAYLGRSAWLSQPSRHHFISYLNSQREFLLNMKHCLKKRGSVSL